MKQRGHTLIGAFMGISLLPLLVGSFEKLVLNFLSPPSAPSLPLSSFPSTCVALTPPMSCMHTSLLPFQPSQEVCTQPWVGHPLPSLKDFWGLSFSRKVPTSLYASHIRTLLDLPSLFDLAPLQKFGSLPEMPPLGLPTLLSRCSLIPSSPSGSFPVSPSPLFPSLQVLWVLPLPPPNE